MSLFLHDNYAYHSGGDDFCLEKIHITFTDEVNLDNCKLNTTYKEHNILYYEYPSAPYKIKDQQIICECQHAYEIILKDEWVFFLLINKYSKKVAFNLYRVKEDGSGLTKMCECNMLNIVIHEIMDKKALDLDKLLDEEGTYTLVRNQLNYYTEGE